VPAARSAERSSSSANAGLSSPGEIRLDRELQLVTADESLELRDDLSEQGIARFRRSRGDRPGERGAGDVAGHEALRRRETNCPGFCSEIERLETSLGDERAELLGVVS
jgi:hypothetical protein